MHSFSVSTIIPVYNAAAFLPNAVLSCVHLPVVQEIILVEDHSPGDDWQICLALEKEFEKVRTFRTPKNSGASAARNLGLKHANAPFISFLDADDEYLKNRFTETENLFCNDPKLDACFGSVVSFYASDAVQTQYKNKGLKDCTGLVNFKPTMNALEALLGFYREVTGHVHLNGLTFKKESFPLTGFNTRLRLHQDTELIFRAACNQNWVSVGKDPIARRRVHAENRITSVANGVDSNLKLFTALVCNKENTPFNKRQAHYFIVRWLKCFKSCENRVLKIRSLAKVLITNYPLLRNRYFMSKILKQ